ncbi:hypothetical protein FA13DRAFT_1625711 [Coprinellus micaceus]|uniref:G-protein coupled receptors family 1 profile domain-containing protein n=1 Tax=Coprinellus micaceus TaxID=71717 RepID=A0A4Y7TKP1_COPMI|nr:hypothetical protein FA13DRAFT_1625711 [Coprinellus micaceus]
MDGSIFVPFPESVMAGALAVNIFAILCTVALLSVALRVAWLGLRWYITKDGEKPHDYAFFQTQLGNYAACLLVAMVVNTGAGIMALPWFLNRGITVGAACTTQAVLNQIGTWSSGFFTVTIAVHTFNSLVLKRKQPLIVSRCLMAVGWIVSGVMASLPFYLPKPNGDIYGPDGLMCGFKSDYAQFRFFLHILPILVAAALSAVLYPIIFLILRGTLTFKGGIHVTLNPKKRWSTEPEADHYNRFIARVARSMIWYPVAYVALLVPYSVLRLLEISGFFVPFQALVFAAVCWFMLGVVNVGLFYNTFRVLGPAFDGRSQTTSTRKDGMESWGPSALLDKGYASSFRRSVRASRMSIREKVTKFHLPLPVTTSKKDSVYSERGLLVSYSRGGNSYGATGYGRTFSKPPSRSMDKVEALGILLILAPAGFPRRLSLPKTYQDPILRTVTLFRPSVRGAPSIAVGWFGWVLE